MNSCAKSGYPSSDYGETSPPDWSAFAARFGRHIPQRRPMERTLLTPGQLRETRETAFTAAGARPFGQVNPACRSGRGNDRTPANLGTLTWGFCPWSVATESPASALVRRLPAPSSQNAPTHQSFEVNENVFSHCNCFNFWMNSICNEKPTASSQSFLVFFNHFLHSSPSPTGFHDTLHHFLDL